MQQIIALASPHEMAMVTRRNPAARGRLLHCRVLSILVLLLNGGCVQTEPSRSLARGQVADFAGSPWKSKKKLWARTEASLSQLPGVVTVVPAVDEKFDEEFHVFTDTLAIGPQEFAGIPITTFPASHWRSPSSE